MTSARAGRGVRAGLLFLAVTAGCGPDPELRPDERLQEELGLSPREEVHTITLSGGPAEMAEPGEVTVPADAWVEFVTTDAWLHEVRFELDSLPEAARAFLTDTDQAASPPMVDPDSRFVVSWAGAPAGRYPFVVEGNGAAFRGAVVVRDDGS